MPLKWTIDHVQHMVRIAAQGEVTLQQIEEYLDAVVVADAMPYAKLFDCTHMVTHATDDEMMELAARMRRLNGLFTSSMSHPAERLAARALDNAEMVLEMQCRRLDRNRAIAKEFVASRPELSWVEPHAGTVGFLRLEGGDVDGLVQRLLANDTLVTPGRFFGDGLADHFRIGFGMEQAHLEEGLRRLGSALDRADH